MTELHCVHARTARSPTLEGPRLKRGNLGGRGIRTLSALRFTFLFLSPRFSIDRRRIEPGRNRRAALALRQPPPLHYIQELKKKHGIGYDSHASYRFVEG